MTPVLYSNEHSIIIPLANRHLLSIAISLMKNTTTFIAVDVYITTYNSHANRQQA